MGRKWKTLQQIVKTKCQVYPRTTDCPAKEIRRLQGSMFCLPHWQIWIKNVSVVPDKADKICDWRSKVLAAEAKKTGNASERTRLIPRPPCLIGKLAYNDCISVICVLEIWLRVNLKWMSDKSSAALSTEGEQCKRCWTVVHWMKPAAVAMHHEHLADTIIWISLQTNNHSSTTSQMSPD